jgi:hypothetical protein
LASWVREKRFLKTGPSKNPALGFTIVAQNWTSPVLGPFIKKKPFEMAHNNSKAIFQNRISTWDSLD